MREKKFLSLIPNFYTAYFRSIKRRKQQQKTVRYLENQWMFQSHQAEYKRQLQLAPCQERFHRFGPVKSFWEAYLERKKAQKESEKTWERIIILNVPR